MQTARTVARTGSRAMPNEFRHVGLMVDRVQPDAATATYGGRSYAGSWWERADHRRPVADVRRKSGTTRAPRERRSRRDAVPGSTVSQVLSNRAQACYPITASAKHAAQYAGRRGGGPGRR